MAARLILIRHGQASFGTGDYDRLSDLGHEQARTLGAMLARAGLAPRRFWTGTMRRHRETLAGIAEGLGLAATASEHPGLDEFDGDRLLTAWRRAEAPLPETHAEARAAHFRDLRRAMLDWQDDRVQGSPETWAAFGSRTAAAMAAMAEGAGEGTTLAVSSGGPIGGIVAAALGAPPATQADLQMQLQNCAMTRLVLARRGAILQSFNENWLAIHPEAERLVTYS